MQSTYFAKVLVFKVCERNLSYNPNQRLRTFIDDVHQSLEQEDSVLVDEEQDY